MYVPPASPPPAYRQPLAVFQAEMCRICTCPARVMLKVCEAEGCDRGEVTKERRTVYEIVDERPGGSESIMVGSYGCRYSSSLRVWCISGETYSSTSSTSNLHRIFLSLP